LRLGREAGVGEKIMATSSKSKIIAVDFDGTCVTHEFPNVGQYIGAAPVLRDLVSAGHKIILYTMRNGDLLPPAVAWFERNNIPLFGVNNNPTQAAWTSSPKVFAHYYIDDAMVGAYLKFPLAKRPYIDWHRVKKFFVKAGML
jgi:hypothetical protein